MNTLFFSKPLAEKADGFLLNDSFKGGDVFVASGTKKSEASPV
jgi:hypothetical protein